MRPDGEWEPGMADRVAGLLLEPLRLLRWTLRLDFYLPSVGQDWSHHYSLANEVMRKPDDLLKGYDLIDRKSLQSARSLALAYFRRCKAEGVRRGFFEPETEENRLWSIEFAGKMAGREGEDFLIGAKIIAEAEEAEIRTVTVTALRRYHMCEWLEQVLTGKHVITQYNLDM